MPVVAILPFIKGGIGAMGIVCNIPSVVYLKMFGKQ